MGGSSSRNDATEDAVLGGLLGLAIGDALGMPAGNGGSRSSVDSYQALERADGTTVAAGEFTDETEFVLAIAEAATTNRGSLDADLIGYRLVRLNATESGEWIDPWTREALATAGETLEFSVPLSDDGPVNGAVATRGVTVGLLHAVDELDIAALRADSDLVTRITHGSPAQMAATFALAWLTQRAARREGSPSSWCADVTEVLGSGACAEAFQEAARAGTPTDLPTAVACLVVGTPEQQIVAGVLAAAYTETFEEAVLLAVNAGGPADTIGAIAGALAGARRGTVDIPQRLIDGLEGRIYVSLAGPWLRRVAMYRAGLIRDVPTDGPPPPRPLFPPRQ